MAMNTKKATAAEKKATVKATVPTAKKQTAEKAAEAKSVKEVKEVKEIKEVKEVKEEAVKAPAKRTPAAKAAKSMVYVQFAGKEFSEKELVEAAKKAYVQLGNKAEDIKTIDVYVKPEESVAYFAVNGQGADEYKVEL